MLKLLTIFSVFLAGIAAAQTSPPQLSPQQKEVWAGEENFFRYLHARDLENYMSLWDDNFVGWPDYEQGPVRKPQIEATVKEEFATPQPPANPLLLPHPEAIEIFGNVAVTHYFWPDADPAAPLRYRITHTWQKSATGWHIIGGMSCEVPRAAGAQRVAIGSNQTLSPAPADDALSAKVDEAVTTLMRSYKIPGTSVAVVRDGKIIKAAGYGLANVELNAAMTPQMAFHSGSLAKAFTATAVMMLVEEGKIGLDDKISKYLIESPAAWDEITIRRLLTHTSGIRDYFGEDGDTKFDFHQDFTEDELVRKFAGQTMRFSPGEKWTYCNAGYVMLGVVIHRVTGKFWFDFVKERIFDPLGMTSTRLISTDDIIPNRASGYSLVNGQWKNDPWLAPSWFTTADGSLYTNVFDMAKWDAALYTDKLIKPSTLAQMWTPVRLNDGTTYPYGFAWRISDVNGHHLIQHDGVDFAFTNRFARYIDDRLSIIVFINLGEDDEAAMPKRITEKVAAIYVPALNIAEGKADALVESLKK